MSALYDYFALTLAHDGAPHRALAEQLAKLWAPALAAQDGEIVGQFAPQLGWWAGDEAAVLVRWSSGKPAQLDALPAVTAIRSNRLVPTLRPGDGDRPAAGGIYVHRWFEIEAASADEFVALSGEGWKDFEARFDARIFGLFRAEPDGREGSARLLLITRYGDHGVWEASRDPTTEAMRVFMRRQQLTRRSWAASTLLVPA
jgi:hypothetical protein